MIHYGAVCCGSLLVYFAIAMSQVVHALEEPLSQLLISSTDLMSVAAMSDVVILDVRKPEEYDAGHIPGAVNVPVAKTFRQSGRTDRVAGSVHLQKLFGQAGVERQKRVTVYDEGSFFSAGRVFWVLEVSGHTNVQLLDGGFAAWQSHERPISQEKIIPKPSDFIVLGQPEKLATKLSMRLATKNDGSVIIDARSKNEFAGIKSTTDRYGHIPRAISIPWKNNITSDGGFSQMKTLAELQQLYGGFDKGKKVITYCNTGEASSFSYFVLRNMGFDVAHYDGSWFEWSGDANLPIVSP